MNKQKQPGGIEWTRAYGRPGYTWNPVGGCLHGCRWSMPDGVTAVCYAETVAERVAQAAYPHGFAHHYWHPERLDEPLKLREPAGIFLDSMSDLMGHWVEDRQVETVLETCARAPQHIFFLLTKNAPRLRRFDFPSNVWVGVSMPPDEFMGRRLADHQQRRFLGVTLDTLARVRARVRWISFEPLSWDVTEIMRGAPLPLEWAVIGAASSGSTYYQPAEAHVRALVDLLDRWRVQIFFKGNLRASPAADPWREEFPTDYLNKE